MSDMEKAFSKHGQLSACRLREQQGHGHRAGSRSIISAEDPVSRAEPGNGSCGPRRSGEIDESDWSSAVPGAAHVLTLRGAEWPILQGTGPHGYLRCWHGAAESGQRMLGSAPGR